MPWFAIHTKPRNELKVCERLLSLGITAYAPTFIDVRQWSDRKKKLRVAYFPSYVFVQLEDRERQRVFCHPGVLRYVFWQGKPAVIRDEEIDMIQNYLEGRNKHQVLIERLKVGDCVVLLRGGFKNQIAYVEQLGNNKARLIFPELGFKITTQITDLSPVREAS